MPKTSNAMLLVWRLAVRGGPSGNQVPKQW